MADKDEKQENQGLGYEKSKIVVNKEILRAKKENQFDNEEFRCRDISPENCEKLRNRKFTNKREDFFIEVRMLEEQYRHQVEEAKKGVARQIKDARKKGEKKYKMAVKNKERELNRDIQDLETEIENSIKELEIKEKKILSEIEMDFKVNTPKLIEDALKIIGVNYLCLDKK